jgi:hypothetical protein
VKATGRDHAHHGGTTAGGAARPIDPFHGRGSGHPPAPSPAQAYGRPAFSERPESEHTVNVPGAPSDDGGSAFDPDL